MADLFLSYKTEDRDRVAPLVSALRAAGFDLWWDQDITPDAPWRETIVAELDAARLCLVVWSQASSGPEGRYVREEAERARRRDAYLGLRIDAVDPPFGFGEFQVFDLAGWRGRRNDRRIGALIEHLRARLEGRKPPVPPIRADTGRRKRGIALVGAILALAALAAFLLWAWPRPGAEAVSPTAFVNERTAQAECSWLQIANVAPAGADGERVSLAGIASSPEAVQAAVMRDAAAGEIALAEIDVSEVARSPPEVCAELELIRAFRWSGRSRLTILPTRDPLRQTQFGLSGRFEFEIDFADLDGHAALLGLDSVGGVEVLVADLHAFRRENPPLRTVGSVVAYHGYFFDENRNARNVGVILMTASRSIADPPVEAMVEAIGRRSDRSFVERLGRTARAHAWQFELGIVRCGFEQGERHRC